MYDDAYTRNEDGELAVRTVNVTEGINSSSYDDVFTRDTNGKLALRVTGSGGSSDSHNKGYYATQAALEEAYPTGEAGDWAIVGATDTVWVWDTDTSAWVDTDTKGEVTPDMIIVKSTTMPTASTTPAGAVYQYVGATNANYTHGYIYENVATTTYSSTVTFEPATLSSSTIACSGDDFAAFVAQWGSGDITTITHGTLTYDQSGGLLVFVGKDAEETTVCTFQLYTQDYEDAGFTITGTLQDGDVFAFTTAITASTSYAWTRIDVQPAPVIPDPLPSQTGQSGKFLTTDGTTASWSDKPLVNRSTGYHGFVVGPTNYTTSYEGFSIGNSAQSQSTRAMAVGNGSIANGDGATAIGRGSSAEAYDTIAIGDGAGAYGANGIAIGNKSKSGSPINRTAYGAIQIGNGATNLEPGTLCVSLTTSNTYGQGTNYKLLDSDGTIPADRLTHAINKYSTMPTASASNEGWIVQYTGTTDSTYTHGHLYECVSDGADPATYSWSEVQLGGGSSYTAGTGIDITSGVISVENPVYTNTDGAGLEGVTIGRTELQYGDGDGATIIGATTMLSPGRNIGGAVVIGGQAKTQWGGCIAIGGKANADGDVSIAIGGGSCTATGVGAIQLGFNQTNADDNTFKVANLNGNFEIMSADGTVPTARLTKVNTTATLAVADWSSNTQTVSITGITAGGVVMVSPTPANQSAYTSAGILCTAQAAGSLTFTCDTVPSADITVTVVML